MPSTIEKKKKERKNRVKSHRKTTSPNLPFPPKKKERKQILETPVEERILSLEAHRAQLVNLRRPLELKREELLLRLQKQQQEEEQKQSEGKPAETPNKCP